MEDKMFTVIDEEGKEVEVKLKDIIKNLDNYTNEELVHIYKVSLTRNTESKGLYTNLIKEIDKLRIKKGWVLDVSSRGVSLDKTTEELKQSGKGKGIKKGTKK